MPETTPTRRSAHLIQGNSSASRPGAHMPVTFEGDEPEEPTSWDLIWAGARWVLLGLAFICSLLAAAGFFSIH